MRKRRRVAVPEKSANAAETSLDASRAAPRKGPKILHPPDEAGSVGGSVGRPPAEGSKSVGGVGGSVGRPPTP
jgi:hypothetical protein